MLPPQCDGGREADAELGDGNDFFGKSSVQLLKHHGTYQQDDRDKGRWDVEESIF